MLDFADDVVPNVADHAALQGWKLRHDGCLMRGKHRLECSKETLVVGYRCGYRTGYLHFAVDDCNLGAWTTADETESSPSLAMLDRLQQESGRVTHQREEYTNGRVSVGEHFGPHRHHAIRSCKCAKLVASWRDAHAKP